MNLWDIKTGSWDEDLLSLTAGSSDTSDLKRKLGLPMCPKTEELFWATLVLTSSRDMASTARVL